MQFSVDPGRFADAVAAAGRIIPAKPVQPEHGGILLAADSNAVTMQAYDLETSISMHVDAAVAEPGRALVSGRLLAQVGKVLPRKPVRVTENNDALVIEAGKSAFRLPLMPAGRYPTPPVPVGASGEVDGERFAAAIGAACSALTGADAVAIKSLFGVRLETEDGRMIVIATDKFRMAVEYLDWTGGEAEILLPPVALDAAAKALRAGPAMLHFGSTFGISSGATVSTMRSLDQGYPAWRKVLEFPHVAMATVDSGELVAALRRAEVVAGKLPHVILNAADGCLQVSAAKTEDVQGAALEIIECRVIGTSIATKVNAEYLKSMVAGLKSDHVTLGFSDPPNMRPLLGFPVEHVDDLTKPDVTSLFAVMPIR